MLKFSPQICILAAGSGTRMGHLGKILNKALLPLNEKAVISHIIEKFPADSEFVVAVGYKSEQVKAYLQLAHPEHKFVFVDVKNYDGPGSGPGHSLLCCREVLRDMFYMIAADTLWSEDIRAFGVEQSWMATGGSQSAVNSNYCNLIVEQDRIVEMYDKVAATDKRARPFAGLAFVKDSALFWRGLSADRNQGERQVSAGFAEIMGARPVLARAITWMDVGTIEKYQAEAVKDLKYDFSKTDEMFYKLNGRVIKFFADASVAENRVKKARLNQKAFPEIVGCEASFYAYSYQPGETLYVHNSPETFAKLLDWLCQNLWRPHAAAESDIKKMCHRFYEIKTEERLKKYSIKYPIGEPQIINGNKIPSAAQLLKGLNWDELFKGEPFFIHGDLQPDNIIFDAVTEKFLLLDWRQDFAGETAFGDLYYDFAKLWAGLCLDYSRIKQNDFTYIEDSGTSCRFTVPGHPYKAENALVLAEFIERRGYSLKKVKLLAALIFLNMSPLHHNPFDKMLHALGREMLFNELQ